MSSSTYLHITNGDSAANIIRDCGIAGEVLPWRDPMHHGPFPQGHSLQEHSRVRIAYLSGEPLSQHEKSHGQHRHGFSERDETLAGYRRFDEVILWFEHDLLDQLQILQLLNWFARAELSQTHLSIICVNEFDGVANFRGIAQLSPRQMATLFSDRKKVTRVQFELASRCWEAFCSAEPIALSDVLASSAVEMNNALPFLAPALVRHCQEFPWTTDGLSRTERQLLTLVDGGVTSPTRIFIDNMNFESCLYIGDWRTYAQLTELCEASIPLLTCVSGQPFTYQARSNISDSDFKAQELCLTAHGKDVLDRGDQANLRRDCWLGGVHLNKDKSMWFWNDNTRVFQESTVANV